MAKNDGGPAYPARGVSGVDEGGLSLRDWFAGQALNAMLSNDEWIDTPHSLTCREAWDYADAMLAERDR